jgi:hypothetical protein
MGQLSLGRDRGIPQLAPRLWKPAFREVSFGQLPVRPQKPGHWKTMGSTGETPANPQWLCQGWEQSFGDSEKEWEQQEVTGEGLEDGGGHLPLLMNAFPR